MTPSPEPPSAELEPTLEALLAREGLGHLATLNRGGWANGDVHLVERGRVRLILKSYRCRGPFIRAIGRYLLGRERRAYGALAGLRGIPRLEAIGDSASLLLEHIPAEKISDAILRERGAPVIESLRALLGAAHEQGVFHMDLRNQGNVLVDAQSQAWLVDFASAVIVRRRHPGARLLAALCRRFDRYGLSKWEQRAITGPG